MKKFTFQIHEYTTYWQSGTVSAEAPTKKEALTKVLAGEYDHHGDNEVILDTEGACLAMEIYEKEKVKKSRVFGKTIRSEELESLELVLKCALADLEGLFRETFPDGAPKNIPVQKTIREIKAALKLLNP